RLAFGLQHFGVVLSLGLARLQGNLLGQTGIADALFKFLSFDVLGTFAEGFYLFARKAGQFEGSVRPPLDAVAELLDIARELTHVDRVDSWSRPENLFAVEGSPLPVMAAGEVGYERVMMQLRHRPVFAVYGFAGIVVFEDDGANVG